MSVTRLGVSLLKFRCCHREAGHQGRERPEAKHAAFQADLIEFIVGSVLLCAGIVSERRYEEDPNAVPPENVGPLVLTTGGSIVVLAGAVGMALANSE